MYSAFRNTPTAVGMPGTAEPARPVRPLIGLYNTVPNGNRSGELRVDPDSGRHGRDTKAGQREKRDKINKGYGTGAGITRIADKHCPATSTSTELRGTAGHH